jgi:hypothetical protein
LPVLKLTVIIKKFSASKLLLVGNAIIIAEPKSDYIEVNKARYGKCAFDLKIPADRLS